MSYEQETYKIVDEYGREWMGEVTYEEICIRKGNFSCFAMDPEEYYGEFAFGLVKVEWVESMQGGPDDELDWYVYYESHEIPEDLYDLFVEQWENDYL